MALEKRQFKHPAGVAAEFDGFLYVADTDNHRMQSSTRMAICCNVGTMALEKDNSSILPVLPPNLMVSSMSLIPITTAYKIRQGWKLYYSVGGFGDDDGMFIYPTKVAISPDGCLYVAESWDQRSELSNDRIQKFDANSVFTCEMG